MALPGSQLYQQLARVPKTGLRALPFEQPIQLPVSPIRLPFETMSPTAPLFTPPARPLPEAPLRGSPAFGAENLATALASLPLIRGVRGTYDALILIRKATLYYGRVKVDAPFYAALAFSPILAQKFEQLENQILGIPLPQATENTGSFISRLVRPEPDQIDLDNAFNRAAFGTSADVSREFFRQREFLRDFGGLIDQPVGFTRQQKIFDAFREGLEFRPLVIAKSEIAAARTQALLEFVRQMQLVGAFSGSASGGAMPGERGDP